MVVKVFWFLVIYYYVEIEIVGVDYFVDVIVVGIGVDFLFNVVVVVDDFFYLWVEGDG